jgi:hypothetical protein
VIGRVSECVAGHYVYGVNVAVKHYVHVVPSNTLGNPAYHTNRTLYHMFV